MSGFGLAPVDGGDLVPLSPGETVLGRGPLLGISDTRISRHHGLLENLNGELRLKPTHVNPCFVLSSLKDDPRPLEKGSWHRLHPGDLFSLLPGRFIYRVEAVGREDSTPRNSQNLEEEGELPVSARTTVEAAGPEQEQVSDPNRSEPTGPNTSLAQEVSTRRLDDIQSNEPPPAPRKRVLPAWMMASVAAPKSPATAPKGRTPFISRSAVTQETPTTRRRRRRRKRRQSDQSVLTAPTVTGKILSTGKSSATLRNLLAPLRTRRRMTTTSLETTTASSTTTATTSATTRTMCLRAPTTASGKMSAGCSGKPRPSWRKAGGRGG
uniref:Aprataxin and PNKP like factor n=1 Tax=Fundulus heteroclitus TaxID=8078 RepID=A0A3Q2PK57_FUNHE